jgi:hypothetical protein
MYKGFIVVGILLTAMNFFIYGSWGLQVLKVKPVPEYLYQ